MKKQVLLALLCIVTLAVAVAGGYYLRDRAEPDQVEATEAHVPDQASQAESAEAHAPDNQIGSSKATSHEARAPEAPVNGKLDHLKTWIGEHPTDEERDFLKLVEIAPTLRNLVGEELYGRLTNLRQEPYYLNLPIDFVDGYFLLHYPPNGHFNTDADRVLIAVRSYTGDIHAVVIKDDRARAMPPDDGTLSIEVRRVFSLWYPEETQKAVYALITDEDDLFTPWSTSKLYDIAKARLRRHLSVPDEPWQEGPG